MRTLDLELCSVKELDTIELTTINGGFNQSAYNAGEKVGEFLRTGVDDLLRLKGLYELFV